MKKRIFTILALLLSILTIFTFVACADNSGNDNGDDQTPVNPPTNEENNGGGNDGGSGGGNDGGSGGGNDTAQEIVYEDSNFTYTLTEDESGIIVATFKGTGGAVTIPSTFAQKPVVELANGLFREKPITSVTIPSSIITIGRNAFRECDELENVVIPEGVKNLNGRSFHGCDKLKNVTIPESIEWIGNAVFAECPSLEGTLYEDCLYFGNDTNPYKVLVVCKNLNRQTLPIHQNTEYIMSLAFEWSKITQITIPEGVKQLNDYVFSCCNDLVIVDFEHISWIRVNFDRTEPNQVDPSVLASNYIAAENLKISPWIDYIFIKA